MSLKINEIFYSIQGESTYSGMPCVFVRLTYCNLRCSYCDTEYAFYEGSNFTVEQILEKVSKYGCELVEVTGGEPLMQNESIDLMSKLLTNGYKVLLETGGSLPINKVPKEVVKIVDFKTPGSLMSKKNLWTIIEDLQPWDEIKFVITNKDDYLWAKKKIIDLNLTNSWTVLLSPTHGTLELGKLSKWVLKDKLKVKVQVQLHKYIWHPDKKGV
tara:strand:+ start:842 stop:1483 length:642 start_codon:yes stop_codon:yes gene_type:complete